MDKKVRGGYRKNKRLGYLACQCKYPWKGNICVNPCKSANNKTRSQGNRRVLNTFKELKG